MPKEFVKIKEIDKQHKDFIRILEKLYQAILFGKAKQKMLGLFDELHDFADLHFKTEEDYFKKFKYKDAKRHIEEHRKFSKKIDLLKRSFSKDSSKASSQLIDYLEDWLVNHLIEMDQKYVPCFKEHGLR